MGPLRSAGLILQNEESDPPAALGSWLERQGLDYEVVKTGVDPLPAGLAGRPFLVVLGSSRHVSEGSAIPWLADERGLVAKALEDRVPMLGICFGAQILASVLGADVAPAAKPEIGWVSIDSVCPDLVPSGPWPQYHSDAFALPPGAELLARGEFGCQAFRAGTAIGVQFHPEATTEIFVGWLRQSDPAKLALAGRDADSLRAEAEARAEATAANADSLFSRAFAELGVSGGVAAEERS